MSAGTSGPGRRLGHLTPPGLLLVTLLLGFLPGLLGGSVGGDTTLCGGYLNGSHGVIQTPGFPVRFPTPISCQWLIHAPPGKKIVLFFTQYYMRESFKLTEFDHYEDPDNFRGKHDLGEVSFEEEVTSYMVYKPFLMLQFQVQKIGNIHLRVFDFLLDVYGFNITYEIVDDRDPVRTDACSVFKCSFLGNCLATHNFETYKCHCFPGFFGDDCQYGPYCHPDKGINMCWNGGKCRYFFGSLVNTCECPPGYYGVLCEKKQEDFANSECEKIGCNQKCIKEDDSEDYRCICSEGYRLMEDNKTCLEKGRMRYNVKTRCLLTDYERVVTPESLTAVCPDFKAHIADRIRTRVEPRLKEFNNFSVVNISLGEKGYFYIEILFVGEKADSKQARRGMYNVTSSGNVCGCFLDKDYMNFNAKPALHMLTLENYDDKPILAGHLLTLVCRVKGSDGLVFRWSKDGAPVQVHRTSRNMWITTVPSSDDESRMSVLNIDHAHMLDEGDFTCEVSDWDETKSRTVTLTVIPAPHVEVTPLVTTVMEGETTRCKCLSADDERGDFQYRWMHGDEQLVSTQKTDAEVVEDLFPIGSRLTVRAGDRTEVYTCVVTAPSGHANSSCQITVTKVSMETRSCPGEVYFGVSWQETAENQTDIKPCPKTHGVLATRRCSCATEMLCTWEEPNFSKCTSPKLLRVEQELTKLQLGYMVNNVSSVVRLLQHFLANQNTTTSMPLTGDLKLAMTVLSGCQEYRRKFSPLALGDATGSSGTGRAGDAAPGLQETLTLASTILTRTRGASLEERREMSMGQNILELFSSIRRDPRVLQAVDKGPITSPAIDLQVSRVSSSSRWDSAPLYTGRHAAVTLPLSLQANSLTPDPPTGRTRRQPRTEETFVMVTAVYENLQDLLNNDSLERLQYSINSQMVSVGPYVRWDDLTSQQTSRIVDIRFEHFGRQLPVTSHNITACLHWRSPKDDETTGEFTTGQCILLQSQTFSTSCRCRTPGHFVVVMTSDTAKLVGGVREEGAVILIVGCSISLTGMLAALLVHLCFWTHMKDHLRIITLNFCLAVIALDCVLLSLFSSGKSLVLCKVQFMATAVFFLGALSFMTLELFHIRFTNLKAKLVLSPLKLCLIGWGVVFCVVVAVVTCGQFIGYSDMVGRYCWLVLGSWEFYAILVPSSIIFAVYLWLLALLIRDVTCHDSCPPQKERRQYIFHICRSVVLQVYLVLSYVMSVAVINSTHTIHQFIFAVAIAALGIIFFAVQCVVMVKVRPDSLVTMKELAERYGNIFEPCVNRVRTFLLNNHKAEIPPTESTGSFKAFLKPAYESKGDSAETTTISTDPKRYILDNSIYKRERKEQLRALLATSSESGSSSKESDPRELLRMASGDAGSRAAEGGGGDTGDSLPPNYRTISEYIANLQRQNQQEQGVADGAWRENHNSLCNCGKCGSTMPFKPARGRSYIMQEEGSDEPCLAAPSMGYGSSRSSLMEDGHVPNPFPGIRASGSSPMDYAASVSGSGSSRADLAPLSEERGQPRGWEGSTADGDRDDVSPLDSPLSLQLEPVMSYVLTEPQGTPILGPPEKTTKKGSNTKGMSKKRQTVT